MEAVCRCSWHKPKIPLPVPDFVIRFVQAVRLLTTSRGRLSNLDTREWVLGTHDPWAVSFLEMLVVPKDLGRGLQVGGSDIGSNWRFIRHSALAL
jgi:hypothetical protein